MPLKDLGRAKNQEEGKLSHSPLGDSPKVSSAPWDSHDESQELSIFQRQNQWHQRDAWKRATGGWEPGHPNAERSRPLARLEGGMEGCSLAGDSSRKDIPDNFQYIDGNTELANAHVILLGEVHIDQHDKDIIKFINTYAKEGDIVLAEGYNAGETVMNVMYAINRAINQTKLTTEQLKHVDKSKFQQWIDQDIVRPLRKNISIFGWDDPETSLHQIELLKKMNDGEESSSLYEKYNLLSAQRDEKMLETIHDMRKNFPDQNIFVIAGRKHIQESSKKIQNQAYIALTPNYEATEEDKERYRGRRQINTM